MRIKLMIIAVLCGQWITCVSQAQENFTGIGIQLGIHHDRMEIIHIGTNTPASKAGLSVGLVVQKIDGIPIEGQSLYDCAKMIRGAVGSKVTLELVDSAQSRTNTIELVRAEIEVSTMQSRELVKIARISGNTNGEGIEKRILEMLLSEGISPCSVVDPYVIAGSFNDDISVPADKQAEAVQLLKQDAQTHKYDITIY
jgi:PDZ domain